MIYSRERYVFVDRYEQDQKQASKQRASELLHKASELTGDEDLPDMRNIHDIMQKINTS